MIIDVCRSLANTSQLSCPSLSVEDNQLPVGPGAPHCFQREAVHDTVTAGVNMNGIRCWEQNVVV